MAKSMTSIRSRVRQALKPVRRAKGLLVWLYPKLARMRAPVPASERRLLMIYDLSVQPFSIGDLIIFQEAGLILREQEGVDQIDLAIVFDPENPKSKDPVLASINEGNVHYHLASILPTVQVNPHLGSLLVFNSHRDLERYVADNTDRYVVWPSIDRMRNEEYLYTDIFNNLIYNYFQKHGRIPYLQPRPHLKEWATAFYSEHAAGCVPVTVNIRNNPRFGHNRNMRIPEWIEFFKECERFCNAKFFVVCALSEVDPTMRECGNVVIAKDYGTSLEQDLALMQTSAMHMGSQSGPMVVVWFDSRPYLNVRSLIPEGQYRGMIQDGDYMRLPFAGPMQRLSFGEETAERLMSEFAEIWSTIDVDTWTVKEPLGNGAGARMNSWLR